ncbi:hypothetical protein BOTBODRAFT_60937 [Botryobasidium botryosum FD-172 SS1]|uniref:Protein kinase domain-containing protein n=1 Tax=Botryobasidium botryosum (strain FD-172 SS1) TaxID=930990 RepID=A0A067N2H4_BOTB1|nr:hypothetical protein BOTBODRAFT_60937 [Botryobasidium botryosum FD-172 SS1]
MHTFSVGTDVLGGYFRDGFTDVIHCQISREEGNPTRVKILDVSRTGIIIQDKPVKSVVCYLSTGMRIKFGTGGLGYTFDILDAVKDGLEAEFDVDEHHLLGIGTSGNVMLGTNRCTGEAVAIKKIRKKNSGVADKEKESVLMKDFRHENIVGYRTQHEDDDHIYLVLEFVDGVNLYQWVMHKPGQFLQEEEAKYYTLQICLGLEHIHEYGVAHRDISAQNILITKDEPHIVKIADFGSAKSIQTASGLKTMCGTPDYMAPEVESVNGVHSTYSLKADCYSLGVTVFFMLTGRCPGRPIDTTIEQIEEVRVGNLGMLVEKAVSDQGIEFGTKLIALRPEDRLSAREALDHEWLRMPSGTPLPLSPLCQLAPADIIQPFSPVQPTGEMDWTELAIHTDIARTPTQVDFTLNPLDDYMRDSTDAPHIRFSSPATPTRPNSTMSQSSKRVSDFLADELWSSTHDNEATSVLEFDTPSKRRRIS